MQVEDLLGRIWLTEAIPSRIQCHLDCHQSLLHKLRSEFETGEKEWYRTAESNVKKLSDALINR